MYMGIGDAGHNKAQSLVEVACRIDPEYAQSNRESGRPGLRHHQIDEPRTDVEVLKGGKEKDSIQSELIWHLPNLQASNRIARRFYDRIWAGLLGFEEPGPFHFVVPRPILLLDLRTEHGIEAIIQEPRVARSRDPDCDLIRKRSLRRTQ